MLPVEELFRVNVIPVFARALYNVPQTFPTSQFIVWALLSSSLHPLLLLPQLVNLIVPCGVVSLLCCHTLPAETAEANQSLCHLKHTSLPISVR